MFLCKANQFFTHDGYNTVHCLGRVVKCRMAEFEIIFSLGGDSESGVILANMTPDSLSPPTGKGSNSAGRHLTAPIA